MQQIIAKMRADWTVVAQDRREAGEWSAEDETEIGEEIKAVIASKNADSICCWARYLADLSAIALGLKVIAKRPPKSGEAKA
jgi:hypothetical protein